MKRTFVFAILFLSTMVIKAQRCLDIGTSALSDLIKIPASAKASFNDCHKHKVDEHGTIEISDYGDNYSALDSFMMRKAREFNMETANSLDGSQMSSASIDNAKELA